MSHDVEQELADAEVFVTLNVGHGPRRYPGGMLACRYCGGCARPPRRTFCSEPCVQAFLILVDQKARARAVFERDGGVCALCGLDAHALWMATPWEGRASLKKEWRAGRRDQLWEADHIVPRSLGGTHDLDNLRTLCLRCHRAETARLAALKKHFVARGAA